METVQLLQKKRELDLCVYTLVGAAYFPCCSGSDCEREQPKHVKAIRVHIGLILLTLTTVPLIHTSRPNTLARNIRNGVSGS